MAYASPTPKRTPTGRPRGRPPGSTNAARAARQALSSAAAATEPPPKRRRYIPGGPGGGGRFVETDELDVPTPASAPRPRSAAIRASLNGQTPSAPPRRERSTRSRASASEDLEEMRWGSAAAVAASVKQAEDYKPREERSWEEFHPNLDIDKTFMVFPAEDVDSPAVQQAGAPLADGVVTTPLAQMMPAAAASTGTAPNAAQGKTDNSSPFDAQSGTPSRRSRRPTREVVGFCTPRPSAPDLGPTATATSRTPRILPISSQTPKERLDLKLPSYRKTNRIELFESKTFGQARYVDKAMSNVGYQESDGFIRPEARLIKAIDGNAEDELDLGPAANSNNEEHAHQPIARLGRVEYDMDEQDDMWLESVNAQRKQSELEAITREVFEITMTKIEKEWHALEKRIPKPNPKPPQTHRPRSSSAVAVNGETAAQGGEEPDSKCAICDDGDCENTNAIVFCDGCNLAVHQECYGVPFIPEGQWLCRKCQLCGRGIPTCIFCPNTDGAFKQTNSSKWAHLLCAMWIPEASLGNHTFMEPVMDVEKVPKTRWKLSCYICRQRMGACIQCSNKNCYQAFHVTCARRAKLHLKMKTSHGALAVLDGNMVLKAFCDKHCPVDYAKEHNVQQAARSAKKFYKKNMRGRIWADNLAMANAIAAQQRNLLLTEAPPHPPAPGPSDGAEGPHKKRSDRQQQQHPPKNMWKLPSGAPIIPQAVFDVVEASIQRFPFRKRKDFLSEACRYWTLKREARRGAGLLKRLQLQMETFSSMELTRRDFSTMGPSGRARLARRIEFAEMAVRDLEMLRDLAEGVVARERIKAEGAELEREFVDECYFPVGGRLVGVVGKAISLDKNVFTTGLASLQSRVHRRFYTTVLTFAQDLGDVIGAGIVNVPRPANGGCVPRFEVADGAPAKTNFSDIRERRKLGKRILKAVQPLLEAALRVESEISNKPFETLQKELEALVEASIHATSSSTLPPGAQEQEVEEEDGDTIMVDAADTSQITVKSVPLDMDADAGGAADDDVAAVAADGSDPMDTAEDGTEAQDGGNIRVDTSAMAMALVHVQAEEAPAASPTKKGSRRGKSTNTSETPPGSDEYAGNLPPPRIQTGPPTPPQSNGSFGKEPHDPLTDGGVLWYLKGMEPRGTSILGEHWAAGRNAVRMLSEELTDLDDEELKGLRAEVDESVKAAGLDLHGLSDGDGAGKAKASGRPRRRRACAARCNLT